MKKLKTIPVMLGILASASCLAENLPTTTSAAGQLVLAANSTQDILAKTEKVAVSQTAEAQTSNIMPRYVPPMRGAPKRRVGGGTRGSESDFSLSVLAPEHTGYTSTAQPKLYFYVSKDNQVPLEFVITNEEMEEPLFETEIKSNGAGIYVVDLAKANISLQADVEYQWFVSAVLNPKHRSQDLISGGAVKYAKADKPLVSAKSSLSERVVNYAQNGYWYDALASLNAYIDTSSNKVYSAQRQSLLEQVGLTNVKAGNSAMYSGLN